ncbi:SymE family type I addiction module toxin [Acerihabitans sp. TG2]|uniref:SymE family type I addiction module toxin n=1 Tax=Acerihabitans sp. TG2 TaxID=3096008 RepID=UPI002B23DDC4|nr:SymE family type I addiction module toxin [Acerihabitans sp. TG2]MEA9389253.1 SymE family type I addiction module toxin [Acerihabitans sp. TG2]
MDELNSKTDRAIATANKTERRYTIGYVPNGGKSTPSPALNLGGKWLAACGFTTGQTVNVAISEGQLIIELVK